MVYTPAGVGFPIGPQQTLANSLFKNKKLSSSIFTFFSIIPLQYNYSFALLARDMPSTHTDAMRLQAENLEEAVHSNVASRVASRRQSIAPSLIASAIQSRRGSVKQSCLGSSSVSRRGSLGPAAFMNLPPGKLLEIPHLIGFAYSKYVPTPLS